MPAFAVSVGDNFIIKKKRGDLKIPVNSGLIEIILFSSCFNYILEGDLSYSTGCVLSFCQTQSN